MYFGENTTKKVKVPKGSYGYNAPECAEGKFMTLEEMKKADIYSFGLLAKTFLIMPSMPKRDANKNIIFTESQIPSEYAYLLPLLNGATKQNPKERPSINEICASLQCDNEVISTVTHNTEDENEQRALLHDNLTINYSNL